MGTIYYLIPDIHKREFHIRQLYRALRDRKLKTYIKEKVLVKHKPVGGIKVMFQHCEMLNSLGFSAHPLQMGSYLGNFFGYDLDVKHIDDVGFHLNNDDVIVCPEFLPYLGLEFSGAKKILFNQSQSWRYLEQRLKPEDMGKNYITLGYDYVINCSEHLCRMLKLKMDIDSYPITNGIDQRKFFPKSQKRVKNRVLALSRKHPDELKKIMQGLEKTALEFRVVDGLTEDEIVNEYQQADIFLATGYPEGLPLPQLEAMNCGCVVVGFSGGGGDEYMQHMVTSLVAKDGNCEQVVEQLTMLSNNDALKEIIRNNGVKKAKEYTLQNTKTMLNNFFSDIRNASQV
jgi:glycosyltransferase involved in cell wall biosynthesis